MLEHPDITSALKTGYPLCHDDCNDNFDEDFEYEERKYKKSFGDDNGFRKSLKWKCDNCGWENDKSNPKEICPFCNQSLLEGDAY